jgi:hypothetical protein
MSEGRAGAPAPPDTRGAHVEPRHVTAGISLGSLRLRVPGHDAASGRRIAERVSAELARRVGPNFAGHIERLDLRVQAPRSRTEQAMADEIVSAVVRALRRRT